MCPLFSPSPVPHVPPPRAVSAAASAPLRHGSAAAWGAPLSYVMVRGGRARYAGDPVTPRPSGGGRTRAHRRPAQCAGGGAAAGARSARGRRRPRARAAPLPYICSTPPS